MDLALLAAGLIAGAGIGYGLARAAQRSAGNAAARDPAGGDDTPWQTELRALVNALQPVYDAADHPGQLADEADFASAVGVVAGRADDAQAIVDLLTGHDPIAACAAADALGARNDVAAIGEALVGRIDDMRPWTLYFALPHLAEVDAPSVGTLVREAPAWWTDTPGLIDSVRRFVDRRVARGERPAFGECVDGLTPERADEIEAFMRTVDGPGVATLQRELRTWRAERTDHAFLASVGSVWGEADPAALVLSTPGFDRAVDTVLERLTREPPRSVLIVGDAGVGKSTLIRAVGRRMVEVGWTVLEADAASLLADQKYLGELEGRLRRLLDNLDVRRRVLWYAPAFQELLVAGRHSQNPHTGVLDIVLPAIEQGRIVVVGEARSLAYERLVAARAQIGSSLEVVRLDAEDEAGTLALGEAWAAAHAAPGEPPVADRALLEEAFKLAGHLLGEIAAPGNLLSLLELTRRHRRSRGLPPPIALDDVLDTLSALSGLPRSVLDDRQPLDLVAVRAVFERAVVGQREAVDCLVDRIAMIKAGLTDPGRPLGVFLLVGPTGTGKTELAKTLARFLFGSAERMVRLDMSEFQDPDSMSRLLGDGKEMAGQASLASAVRRQPFSVVLLDEFEKASRPVWDVFLQVFDDGRLTDRRGNTANFRHTIILLTSNLGAAIGGSRIGFVGDGGTFSPSAVQRAVTDTFRPEFLNRLDRVIVFEPLSRAVMREILRKELEASLQRRGLRTRQWAVEWEESVIEFLLEKGFTAELGARPLRRAIERHVLGPLSARIVEHRFPDGDQFLFLRSDGTAVQAEFVDPDAPEEAPADARERAADAPAQGPGVGAVALAARGTPEELALLESAHQRLRERVESAAWVARKRAAMEATRDPGFWERDDRATVLGEIELTDRIEAALGTASSLVRRLKGGARGPRERYPASVLSRLAAQIHLLHAACGALDAGQPQDAIVVVEAFADPQLPKGVNESFARRLAGMYRAWAKRRRMRLRELRPAEVGESVIAAFAVGGLGAFALLEPEAGLHVWEEPDDAHRGQRVRARVRVMAPSERDGGRAHDPEAALKASLAATGETAPGVVRHYREAPSPLVRDRVRGWRTGRLDRVLGGDFDLVA